MQETTHNPPVPLLLGAQTAFNIGFYAVVPLIALVLADNFSVGATAIGVILGVRTFAQQGMFLIGGALADGYGARRLILWGVLVRVLGFLGLGLGAFLAFSASSLGLFVFIGGTVLTGLGGAMFSPALNLYIARADSLRSRQVATRTTLFAWLNVTGEMGAVVGPLLGYALLGWGFSFVALTGAALFGLLWILFWVLLPREAFLSSETDHRVQLNNIFGSVGRVFSDRAFTRFAGFHAVDLFSYNQLYFALPLVAAASSSEPEKLLSVTFTCLSVLTLVGQLPLSRFVARFQTRSVLRTGYSMSALGMLTYALALFFSHQNTGALASSLVVVASLCIGVGHLLASPQGSAYVARYAPAHSQAAYLGFIATCGGVVVLVGNLVLGGLLDVLSAHAAHLDWGIWVLVAVAILVSALLQKGLPARSAQ